MKENQNEFNNYLVGSNADSDDDHHQFQSEKKENDNEQSKINYPVSNDGDLKFDKKLLFEIEEELRKQKEKHAESVRAN